jgi:hypothetical protein
MDSNCTLSERSAFRCKHSICDSGDAPVPAGAPARQRGCGSSPGDLTKGPDGLWKGDPGIMESQANVMATLEGQAWQSVARDASNPLI